MGSQRQRRPQQHAGQHERERLQQVLARLQSALQLGLRSPSSSSGTVKFATKKWCSTDAEVQVQATRAILAFVTALSSHTVRYPLLQVSVEESVTALESLLGAAKEAVYSKAAEATAALVATTGEELLRYDGERLVGPLAHLLKCRKLTTAISVATALHGILVKVKPRPAWKGSEDAIWKALEDADALGVIMNFLREDCECPGKDAVFMEVLAVILERWPEARYRVGRAKSVPSTLLSKCMSTNVMVAQGALRASTALALCGCVTALVLRNAGNMWSAISFCLHPSKPHNMQLDALRLLTSLCKVPSFGASFIGPHIEGIAAGCARALGHARSLGETRLTSEVELLIVEAAHATSSVLSWPGLHHTYFLRNGVEDSVILALSGIQSKKDGIDANQGDCQLQPQALNSSVDRKIRGNKLNPRLRPLFWEIVGWLGAHCNTHLETTTSAVTLGQRNLSKRVPALACGAFLKALCRRGQNPSRSGMVSSQNTDSVGSDPVIVKLEEEHPLRAQEVVQIFKAVLLLLSSSSQGISSFTKTCLEDALELHGIDSLPSLVKTLALAGSNTTKIDHVQTVINTLALACLSCLDVCQEQLLQLKAMKAVLEITKVHTYNHDHIKTERLSLMGGTVHPIGIKACCIDVENWEGDDAVLFSSLWALSRLLQGSDWAKEVRGSMTAYMLDSLMWGGIKDGEVLHLLWELAFDKARAPGIRWGAVCCLASFGVYGFPSVLGKHMKRGIEDSSFSDITYVLGDGSRMSAHGVMLAARCGSLLPVELHSKLYLNSVTSDFEVSNRSNAKVSVGGSTELSSPVWSSPEVHLSPRFTHVTLKILLEFVYTGVVYIPLDLVAEMKVLAKRCNLEPLISLLQGKGPVWGQPPAPCDLTLALGSRGYPLMDILLQAENSPTDFEVDSNICRTCNMLADHYHAHRFVLASRCDYFQALFRSGMRDSAQEKVKMSGSMDTIVNFLLYLYSGELVETKEVPDCAWRYSGVKSQLGFLQALVDLAELAGQCVLEELQQQTYALIIAHLEHSVHLCPPILRLAADKQQWALVDSCATCLAPVYPQLRDLGAFDDLHELTDLIRAAHVKQFLAVN